MVTIASLPEQSTYASLVFHELRQDEVYKEHEPLSRETVHWHVAGYEFSKQGIQSCKVDTAMPVGSLFEVTFVVFDYAVPSNKASISRTLTIVSPCEAGQHMCPDGQCSTIDCDTRSTLSIHISSSLRVL